MRLADKIFRRKKNWKLKYFLNAAIFHVLQEMLQDKLRATDWEATYEAMEEAVARESYLEWLKENERRSRKVVCMWFNLVSKSFLFQSRG